MQTVPIHAEQQATKQELEAAFHAFNQVSEQLTDSYQRLQEKVVQLNGQLVAVPAPRPVEPGPAADRRAYLWEMLPAAVVVLDTEGGVQEFNPAASNLLPGLISGGSWGELYSAAFVPGRSGNELQLQDGRRICLYERVLEPDAGRILLMVDVTGSLELQEQANRQERLATMGKMAAQLAHQIRTPLASALLDASHLSRNDLSIARRDRFASRLCTRLQHIEHQIKDMLAFARGGQGEYKLVAVAPLLEELRQLFQPQLQRRELRLDISDRTGGKVLVNANRDALLGALANLITNAVEHGEGDVHLTLRLDVDAADELQIRISDNGPGIPPELRERIFAPFFTTRSNGTGLGLAVVQSVVNAHGGHIEVLPTSEGGTCFQLSFPLSASRPVPDAADVDDVCSRSLS
jgi:two-component system sensor histidine kinase FlrB